jgi:cytochrome c oxidase subunit IV
MSATETQGNAPAEHDHADHPGPAKYVNIAIVLAVLTALEVSTYYLDFGVFGIPLLIVLMTIKFVLVGSFFMHLKFDTKIYTRLLYTGLAFAVVLYAVTLLLFAFGHAPTL